MSDFIFQCVPKRYDLSVLRSPPERPQTWQATRFRGHMRPGDGVFLYMSGDKAGIYGCGCIVAPADAETMAVLVQWTALYPIAISRSELERILSHNLLFTVRVGTNFLLSPEEASALRSLISSRGLAVP
jgi:hypothetical protein